MRIIRDWFKRTVHALVVSDTDGFFEMHIEPNVFTNMRYLIYKDNVFRIKSVLALDKAVDDFDAILHVDHCCSYYSFFNEE